MTPCNIILGIFGSMWGSWNNTSIKQTLGSTLFENLSLIPLGNIYTLPKWWRSLTIANNKERCQPGTVANARKPSTLQGWEGWITRSGLQDQPDQHGEPQLCWKYKIRWAWWHMPVIPATQEAEAGEALEPGRWRLQWAEIALLHSSLGYKCETPSQKKKLLWN